LSPGPVVRISLIVPVLNEESTLPAFLAMAAQLNAFEIIVADGGSTDRTAHIARAAGATFTASAPGRGPQMNAGAALATGDVLLFLHADARLRPGALSVLAQALADPNLRGGIFDVVFDGGDWVARTFNFIYHWRRYCGIFYGDAGIFVRREVFTAMGGFRNFPIMEDYEFGRRLFGWGGRMALLQEPIHISDRRWRKAGLLRTLAVWVVIQTAYSLGYPAERLGRLYRQIR
jgi:rSAM/selenodomain-associated transferase 2